MKRAALALVSLLWGGAALCDEVAAKGADLRVLDRMTDKVEDLHLEVGGDGKVGRIAVRLDDCRYPEGEPGDSIAHLTIEDSARGPVFAGWMSAASPALNALDHPRYDVWLLSCDAPPVPVDPAPSEGN